MPLTKDDIFNMAVKIILLDEGRMSDDPVNDPSGGLTKFGISQTQHPEVDVASLTQDGAVLIYRHQYWDADRCGEMPWPLCLMVFDTNVNQGPGLGPKLLQMALNKFGSNLKVDGRIGDVSMKALLAQEPWELTARMLAMRLVVYSRSSLWPNDGEGWSYRVAKNALTAGRLWPSKEGYDNAHS